MTQRNTILVGALAAVAVIAAYWMLLLSPKRDVAAKLRTDIDAQQTELQAAQAQLASYRKAKETYKANYATVARLGKAVPEDDDVRSLLVQLDAAANQTKVDFRSLRVGEGGGVASDGQAAAGVDAPPPGAVVGEAGFVTMPFSFDFHGKFFRLSNFMAHLEKFVALRNDRIDVTGRLLVLESLSLEPGAEGFPNISAKIGASSYLLPASQGLTAGATPAGPAATTPAATADSSGAIPTTATAGAK